jgi:anti-sigma factor RsiW
MRCADCRDLLSGHIDGELMTAESQNVRDHLAECAECAREHELLARTSTLLRQRLVRHSAPDVLKARIRNALAQPNAFEPPSPPVRSQWMRLAAAGVIIAAASSALTFATLSRANGSRSIADEVVASHVRSLMPGHLTDVASTNQHNVKPWFNGRIDLSPVVPALDSAGFPLIGGRLDYLEGRAVAAVVYARRQHVINVYSWPVRGPDIQPTEKRTEKGYHLVEWRRDGIEAWAVSDLNRAELTEFVRVFMASR